MVLAMETEVYPEELTWTYRLVWKKRREAEPSSVPDFAIAHCMSNAGLDVDIMIGVKEGWLGWTVGGNYDDRQSHANIRVLKSQYAGRTGLMTPITAAIREVLGVYLAEQKPNNVAIEGTDEKRGDVYRSWVAWEFPGYRARICERRQQHSGGVIFERID